MSRRRSDLVMIQMSSNVRSVGYVSTRVEAAVVLRAPPLLCVPSSGHARRPHGPGLGFRRLAGEEGPSEPSGGSCQETALGWLIDA
eukprot:6567656-Pyramimonas_sp.AAC.1